MKDDAMSPQEYIHKLANRKDDRMLDKEEMMRDVGKILKYVANLLDNHLKRIDRIEDIAKQLNVSVFS